PLRITGAEILTTALHVFLGLPVSTGFSLWRSRYPGMSRRQLDDGFVTPTGRNSSNCRRQL
ncbi:hypothetical protein RRG08_053193, partial [Elysia crispata]